MWRDHTFGPLTSFLDRFRAAWPSYPKRFMGLIVIAWAVPAVYTLVNTFFIGQMEMEAIAISEQYENVGVILEILLETFPLAVLALVAQDMTRPETAGQVVRSAMLMQLVLTVGFMVLILVGTGLFVSAINTPIEIQQRTQAFLQVKVLAVPFESLGLLFIIALKAMRKGGLAVGIAAAGVAMNVVLDVLLISNFSFSLRLGLMGSAWDYVVTKGTVFFVAGTAFYATIQARPEFRLERKEANAILRIGKYTGLESAVRNAGYILGVLIVLNTLGAAEYGGYGVAMTIMWLIFLIPVQALGEATNVAIGNEYGRRSLSGMRNVQFVSLVVMGGYMALMMLIGVLVWEPLSWFFNTNAAIVTYSVATFRYLAVPYVFYAIGTALRSLFIGTGKTFYFLIPSTLVNLGIYIPLGVLVKVGAVTPTFEMLMILSIAVFTLDLVVVSSLVRRQYRELRIELAETPASLPVRTIAPRAMGPT